MNILTFDIEDWFHKLNHHSTRDETDWNQYSSRVEENTCNLLDILDRHAQKAVFFCLGWIARQYPGLIKKIHAGGHEIGCHSDMHALVYEMTETQFLKDLKTAKNRIEDLTGTKVVSYRSPGFSLTAAPLWSFECLVELGFENDCSIAPHVGIAEKNIHLIPLTVPSILLINGKKIREFPLSSFNIAGYRLVFSGGGYFRLFPYRMISMLMKRSDYIMTYLHPHDLDPSQPVIKDLSSFRQVKSRIGLRKAETKFNKLISEFDFIDLRTAIKTIDWDSLKTIELK